MADPVKCPKCGYRLEPIELSIRLRRMMESKGIESVEEFRGSDIVQLLRETPNIGPATIGEIVQALLHIDQANLPPPEAPGNEG